MQVEPDVAVWNKGVDAYRSGDVTNALRVLRPLLCSTTHGARAAELVAKLEHERGNRVEAAAAAQIALRAAPDDPRANRNYTRAADGLGAYLEAKHVEGVLKGAEGKDPGSLLEAATADAQDLMTCAGSYRTNAPARAVALSDALSGRAERLADAWLPVRQAIAQSVTNEQQAATILDQLNQAQAKTKRAAKELADLDGAAYSTLAEVESDFTRFLKLTVLPPAALARDLVCQSNAWQDVEAFNSRPWQADALDYTRAFRAKFPAWARAYEQQAQADTNKPPFKAEDQAKVSALATELEKIQLECAEKELPPMQEKALGIIREIQDLLPKDKNGGGQNNQQQNPAQKKDQDKDRQQDQNKDQNKDQQQDQQPNQTQQQDPQEQKDEEKPQEKEAQGQEGEEKEDQEVEAVLKAAQERNDEHEADKKARMRKMKLPPNERDW